MSNGEPLVVRGALKPISTLTKPLRSVDTETKEPAQAMRERTDSTVVPAAGVVAEAMVALVLAALLPREVRRRPHRRRSRRRRRRTGSGSIGAARREQRAPAARLHRLHGRRQVARPARGARGRARRRSTPTRCSRASSASRSPTSSPPRARASFAAARRSWSASCSTAPAARRSRSAAAACSPSACARRSAATSSSGSRPMPRPPGARIGGRRPLAQRPPGLRGAAGRARAALRVARRRGRPRARRRAARALAGAAGAARAAAGHADGLGAKRLGRVPGLRRPGPARRPATGRSRGGGSWSPTRSSAASTASALGPVAGDDRGRARRASEDASPRPSACCASSPRSARPAPITCVALGGGVVGDLAGFCAAVYQRGVPVVQAADDARRPGRLGLRRQDRGRPAGGQELRRRLPPAGGGARRHRDARDAAARRSSRPGSPRCVKTALIAGGELWERVRALERLDPGDARPDRLRLRADEARGRRRRRARLRPARGAQPRPHGRPRDRGGDRLLALPPRRGGRPRPARGAAALRRRRAARRGRGAPRPPRPADRCSITRSRSTTCWRPPGATRSGPPRGSGSCSARSPGEVATGATGGAG